MGVFSYVYIYIEVFYFLSLTVCCPLARTVSGKKREIDKTLCAERRRTLNYYCVVLVL